MQTTRAAWLPSVIVVATGVLWGVYWLPVRQLAERGLSGAWGTLAIVTTAALILAPMAVRQRQSLAAAPALALGSMALGGAAFVLYSVGLLYGRVAIVILLFFLTPVWSTLIGRFVLGWPVPILRYAAIAAGLAGLTVMLGAEGGVPLPSGLGEWLGLAAGFLWSVSTTGMRASPPLTPVAAAFVFALGGCAAALLLAPALAPWPGGPALGAALVQAAGWTLAAGGLWWGVSMVGLLWAARRLEPARVGILLMAEVLVGAASGALLAGEQLGPAELAGGALVLLAGGLELWPVRRRAVDPSAI